MAQKDQKGRGPHNTRYGAVSIGGPKSDLEVNGAGSDMLADVVEGVTKAGDCIMFSRTSDGGALHIRILSGGLVEKWYPSSNAELSEVLDAILGALAHV